MNFDSIDNKMDPRTIIDEDGEWEPVDPADVFEIIGLGALVIVCFVLGCSLFALYKGYL